MRSARHFSKAFLLLLIALCFVNASAATDDDYPDEYDVTARVVRVSLLSGDVSLRRAGNKDWERARLNLPLVEGDTLATGHDARLEIQIDSRNFVRVSEDSVLRLVTLRDEGIALSLTEGTATLRLARFDHDHEYFEIDAPRTTLAAEKSGLYRLDVSREGNVHLTVRDGGRARIYSENSGFTLRDGRTAELLYDESNEPDWQLSKASAFDSWDDWVDQRERYLVQQLRYEQRDRYYDNNVWGAEELDAYGDWAYAGDYGWVWRPRITVINNYNNWAPYRYGHWTWCPPYGWTWVGDEPWGWAPYHYGRWVYYNDNWCWAPRGYGYHYSRSWWRPALVAFVYIPTSYGEHVAWYPLGYGQHDPHSRRYQQNKPERLTPLRSNDVARLERINPAALRAVTTLPARSFGVDDARMQPATTELARRAIMGDPVRGRLPIAPANGADANTGNGAAGSVTGRPMRPARGASASLQVPAATLPERPTGAAARRPGAPLDDELRRTRLYNGREPRDVSGVNERNSGGGTQDVRDRDTGAVTRPARPAAARPAEPRVPVTNDGTGRGESRERRPMPERRPLPDASQQEQPGDRPPQRPDRITGPDRPTEDRPVESERPARPDRREPVDRPQPVERPERHERQDRVEPPSRHESPARSEPPQRSEPAPSRPEPRHEEPPQHREQPAPSRPADPPREKSEPPRERERNEAPARPSRTSTKDPGER